ncbi:MAG: 2-oxo acid dehydrogenase subunit E2 [Chloroflexi bacterium]|nr:2-oxo acid dehydrogenase subunit E2 [Chloroflexota bacterium]
MIPLKGIQKVIATRLHESLQTTASVPCFGEIDVQAAEEWRQHANEGRAQRLSWTHLVLFALSRALPKHPLLNAAVVDEEIRLFSEVNLGLAVNRPDGALLVPVIQGAQSLSLDEIAARSAELGAKTRDNRLAVADMTGGTFTLSSYGTLRAVRWAASIINPPQTAILGVGRVEQRPVVRDGQLAVSWLLPFSLTYDHRAVNGVPAMELMETMAAMLAQPGETFG